MKNNLITLFAFLFFSNNLGAQSLPVLKAGVYINDSIGVATGYCSQSCFPNIDLTIEIDTNLVPLVTGVDLLVVITKLVAPKDSVYTLEKGVLHQNDTLSFSKNPNTLTFYFRNYGCMDYKLILRGTPIVPFELYSCKISDYCSLSSCNDNCYIQPNGGTCQVGDFDGLDGPQAKNKCYIIQSLTADYFEINYDFKSKVNPRFQLFNIEGQELINVNLQNESSSNRFSTSSFKNGIYLWKLTDTTFNNRIGKLIISK